MAIRFIISIILLTIGSHEIMAKRIVLPELDISNMPELETVLYNVVLECDSALNVNNRPLTFLASLSDRKNGYYLNVKLLPKEKLPNTHNYKGFCLINGNIIIIHYKTTGYKFQKKVRKKTFNIDVMSPQVDGTISWIYFIQENTIHRIAFNANW